MNDFGEIGLGFGVGFDCELREWWRVMEIG